MDGGVQRSGDLIMALLKRSDSKNGVELDKLIQHGSQNLQHSVNDLPHLSMGILPLL